MSRVEQMPWKPSVIPGFAFRCKRQWMALSDPVEAGFVNIDKERRWVGIRYWRRWKRIDYWRRKKIALRRVDR